MPQPLPPPPQGQSWTDAAQQMLGLFGIHVGPQMQNTGTADKPLYEAVEQTDPRSKLYGQNMFGATVGPEGFYSHAENVLNETKQGMFQGSQLLGYLKSKGVKDEELRWTGLQDLAAKPKVSREEALALLSKAPRVSEKVLANTPSAIELGELQREHHAITAHMNTIIEQLNQMPEAQASTHPLAQQFEELQNARVDVENKMNDLANVKSPQYERPDLVLPGPYQDYQEILLKHEQPRKIVPYEQWKKDISQLGEEHGWDHLQPSTEEGWRADYEKYVRDTNDLSKPSYMKPLFTGSHHQEDDVLAHMRLNKRYLPAERYTPMYNTAMEDFKKAGISLDTSYPSGGRPANLRMRKWGTQESVTPEQLTPELRKKWDALQEASHREATNPMFPDRGSKVLHVDEFQSDWANQGRSQGFKDPKVEQEYQKLSDQHELRMDEISLQLGKEEDLYEMGDGHIRRFSKAVRNDPELQRIEAAMKALPRGGIEKAPFVEGSWPALAAKRSLLEAARDPEVKYVTWTTGAQQADRYNLDKHVQWIAYNPELKDLNFMLTNGERMQQHLGVDEKKLEEFVGRELAQKLLEQPVTKQQRFQEGPWLNNVKVLKGENLRIENKGKRQFYDRIMPQEMKKLTKQEPQQIALQSGMQSPLEFNQKDFINWLEENHLPTAEAWSRLPSAKQSQYMNEYKQTLASRGQKVWSIKLTPELRKQILEKGFPLYALAPPMLSQRRRESKPLPPPTMMKAH